MSISPGDNVGPYRIIESLGQGGMATVFKAYHPALDRYVAIKVLHPAFKEDPNFLARFRREARIVARLDHPNIVPIYDYAEHEGTPYLVMRYVEGKTLKAVLREGLMPPDRALEIIRPVTAALAYAHAQGVLHRDIKPSNVIRANDDHIYLTDFGLARIAQAGDSTLSQDMLIGTPQYISPEQARGATADERSDIYSLGVVLFEMLTGRVPFSADTPYAVIHDHIYTPLPLPTSINPNLSHEIERVLLKALAKDPDARFATPTELMTALDQAVAAAPPPAPTAAPIPVAVPVPSASAPTPTPVPVSATAGAPSTAVFAPAPSKPQRRWSRKQIAVGMAALFLALCCLCIAAQAIAPRLGRVIPLSPAATRALRMTPDPLQMAKDQVTANPQDPRAHLALAEAYVKAKEYEAAFAEFDQAIKLDPKLGRAYLQAGKLATSLGEFDRAAKYFQYGREAMPEDLDLLLAQGDLFFKWKKYEDAQTAFEKVLRAKPDSAAAMWRLGDVYRVQGKAADALREYSRAIVTDPNLPEAHYGLGMLALGRGATEEARRQFQIVINNPETPPDLRDQARKQLEKIGEKP